MSKDIWHEPIETTDVDNNLIIDDWTNGTYELGYFDDNDMIFRNFRKDDTYYEESMMRWCDVDDLIHDYNRTRKALEQSEICCTEWEKQALDYKAENIALSGDLERTRKALDAAVDALNAGKTLADIAGFKMLVAGLEKALVEITALEQKDE